MMNLGCSHWHCDWKGDTSEMLTAPSPFDPEDSLTACPKCKGINCLIQLCDEPGCTDQATCGTPTPAGYRTTCGTHAP